MFLDTAMKSTLAVGVIVVVLCGPAASLLSAQGPAPDAGRVAIHVVPRVGLLSPDTYFYEEYRNFSGDGPVEWTNGSIGRALILGLGFEAGRPAGGIRFRGEVLRSFDGWMSAAHSVVVPRQLFEPPYVQTTWFDVPTAVTMTSLHAILPTQFTFWRAEPYVLAGLAGKHYDFDDPTRSNDAGAILPSNGSTWGVDVGAGVTVRAIGLVLDLQFRDAINRYWGKTEHDLVFSTGSLWRIR